MAASAKPPDPPAAPAFGGYPPFGRAARKAGVTASAHLSAEVGADLSAGIRHDVSAEIDADECGPFTQS